MLPVDKEFEISGSKGGSEIAAVDFLVKAELESFSVIEELEIVESRSVVIDGPTSNRVGDNLGEVVNAIA